MVPLRPKVRVTSVSGSSAPVALTVEAMRSRVMVASRSTSNCCPAAACWRWVKK